MSVRKDEISIKDLDKIRDELRKHRIPPRWDGEKWVYWFPVTPNKKPPEGAL